LQIVKINMSGISAPGAGSTQTPCAWPPIVEFGIPVMGRLSFHSKPIRSCHRPARKCHEDKAARARKHARGVVVAPGRRTWHEQP
jgi:hypothetical protein